MKATGIVRRIDDLGRVVVPKEIRRTLRIREGDPLEIFTDREGEIILKKYSPIGELSAFAGQYAESLAQTTGCLVCICDMDQVVAAAGSGKKELTDKYISSQLMKLLGERTATTFPGQEKASVKIVSEQEGEGGKLCGRLFRPSDGAVEKGGKQKSGNKSQYTVITCDRQGGTADGKTDSKRYKDPVGAKWPAGILCGDRCPAPLACNGAVPAGAE